MKDTDDEKLKAEIDDIMKGVEDIMKRIESLDLVKNEDSIETKSDE